MRSMTHEEVQEQLDALFIGDAAPLILATREHLKTCPECRVYFDAIASADAWVETSEGSEQSFEARYSLAVMQAVDFQAAQLDASRDEERSLWSWFSGWWNRSMWNPVVATLALFVIALTTPALWNAVWGEDDPFSPRGMGNSGPERVERVEMFCVEVVGEKIQFHDAPEGAPLECGVDEELKFALINTVRYGRSSEQAWRYVTLVSQRLDQPERLHWYVPTAPAAAGSASVAIDSAERLKPLGETIRLSINHHPGTLRLVAIFSEEPVLHAPLAELLRAAPGDPNGAVREMLGAEESGRYAVTTRDWVIRPAGQRAAQP